MNEREWRELDEFRITRRERQDMDTTKKCMMCGADYNLHSSITNRCPTMGQDAGHLPTPPDPLRWRETTYEPEPDPEQGRDPARERVWREAWVAVAGTWNSNSAEIATKWADAALAAFDARFRKGAQG